MDPDIAADPDDLAAMHAAAAAEPDAVHVAAHKLWPASTGRDSWAWGFGPHEHGMPVMTQQIILAPGWFAMGMTYTPQTLLDAVHADLPCWEFGAIDMSLSSAARLRGIPIMPVWDCTPKHLHFVRQAVAPAAQGGTA